MIIDQQLTIDQQRLIAACSIVKQKAWCGRKQPHGHAFLLKCKQNG